MNVFALDPFVRVGSLGDAGSVVEAQAASWMSAGDCKKFLDMAETYTRLSNKTDKSKDTRTRAAQYAAGSQAYYNQCMERKAQAAVQTIVQQQVAAQAPVGPAAGTSAPMIQAQGESWISANKWLLIGGGVAVAALVVFLIIRRK